MTKVKDLLKLLKDYDKETEVFFDCEGYDGEGKTIFFPIAILKTYETDEGLTIQFMEN